MSILNERNMRGYKQLEVGDVEKVVASVVSAGTEQKGSATPTHADMSAALAKQNDIIEKQNAIITEQNAKLKAMTSAVSALMGMVTRLKAEKPQAEAPQKEESSTMAQLKKRFGL